MRLSIITTWAKRIGRWAYFSELKKSKLVVSPFGYGEINYRDFEAMLCGAALLKPDMSHMETWPDLFQAGQTLYVHAWDFSDLDAVIGRALADDRRRRDIAREAQRRYIASLAPASGGRDFALRFDRLIQHLDDGLAPA